MNRHIKFAFAVGGWFTFFVLIATACAVLFWYSMDASQRAVVAPVLIDHGDTLVLFTVLLLAALAFVLTPIFARYVIAPQRLAEGARVIATANPSHRLPMEGSAEARDLAAALNLLAERYESSLTDMELRIAQAKRSVEDEKDRLAALMSELALGVLVCNLEGRILLYNARARELLTDRPDNPHSLVGLGRSIFAVIDRSLISHGLEQLSQKLEREPARPIVHFVATMAGGQLFRAHMAPVLADDKRIRGYILTLEDIRQWMESVSRRDELLQSLTERSRAAAANIGAAVETLQSYPDMDTVSQHRFITAIGDEVQGFSRRLHEVVREHAAYLRNAWPLEEMLGADLVTAAQRTMEHRIGARIGADTIEDGLWLRVDSHLLIQALTYLAGRLCRELDASQLQLRLTSAREHACLDLLFDAPASASASLLAWDADAMTMPGEASPLTVKDVMDRHAGEIWLQRDKSTTTGFFRMLLPLTQPQRAFPVPLQFDSRPEYYDFDLFQQAAQTPELESRRLSELSYTAFDTETTGLDPSAGDEIIALGAIRIVNGRLLRHEVFEQLIDPKRAVSAATTRITGIEGSMLTGQPTIDQVLPAFHRYCEDTVLVAHNAAFDMRFLQLKEGTTGIRFTQPVLDTLLLSAVLHPTLNAHTLEAIAGRLGVSVLGRHTALGDARVTAEIFLHMMALLAERGIVTLRDAREASRKTYYARLRY